MTGVLIAVVAGLACALAGLAVIHFGGRRPRGKPMPAPGARRILFPFTPTSLAPTALDAALRLARAEDATLVPVFLASVPLHLPLDAPLPRQSAIAIPLQETIEQRAASYEIPVDSRIARGRTYRHALRQAIADEHYDRMVVAAGAHGHPGFDPDFIAWLLDHAPGEIVVLRPGSPEQLGASAARRRPPGYPAELPSPSPGRPSGGSAAARSPAAGAPAAGN
jgi:nucleotide-binding universal stress UspA family protein